MADTFKTIKVTQNPGGPLQQQLVGAVDSSSGAADAGKVVLLNSTGQISPSMGGGSAIKVNGVTVSNPDFTNGDILFFNASGTITATVHALATSGASVTIDATAPTHQGQLLISQPGNLTASWADPLVQGVYAPGTNVNTGGISGGPINPVLVGAQDPSNLLANLQVDASGSLKVTSSGSFTPALTADRTATGNITSNQTVVISCAGAGTISLSVTGTWTGILALEASADGSTWTTVDVTPIPFGNLVSNISANGQWYVGVGGLNSFRVRGNTVATGTAVIWLEAGAGSNGLIITEIVQGSVSVSNFPATQTISGNVTAAQGSPGTIANSWPIAVTDLTNVLLTASHPGVVSVSGSASINVHDGGGTSILSTSDSGTVGLNVHVTNTGGLGGTQYVEGTNIGATGTGTLSLAKNPSNLAEALHIDASNNLLTNVNVALPTGTNTIGSVKITDGTNVLGTAAHPVITQDVSDGTPGLAVPATALFVAGKDNATGFLHGLSTDSNGVLNVNAAVSGSFTPALTADRTASGTLTTIGGTVTVSTQGVSGVVFNIVNDTTAWAGTIVFEASPDGTNWYPVTAFAKFPSGAGANSTTANGQWAFPAGGLNSFRLRASTAITGGTGAKVWIEAGAGALIVEVAQTTATNLNATVTQGAANSPANGWPVKITDGTNILGTTGNPVVVNVNNTPTVTLGAGANNIGYTSYQVPTLSRMTRAVINFSSSGANTLVAGVGGQTIRVWRIHFNCGGSTQITWLDGVTAMSGPFSYSTGGGEVLDFSGDPWYITTSGNDLKFNSSNAVQVGGTIWFTQS